MNLGNKIYKSEGIKWHDSYSGKSLTGLSYNYIYLRNDNLFAKVSKKNPNFNFIKYLENKSDRELEKDSSITFGNYKVTEGFLELTFIVWGEKRTKTFKILSNEVIIDEELKEYQAFLVEAE